MSDGLSIDTSELTRLSASFDVAESRLPGEARKSVFKGALNVKTAARERVSDNPSWKHLAATINFDVTGNRFQTAAEVGYDDTGQGELAGIAEFGSAHHAPHPALIPAFAEESPRFEKAMADILAEVLGDAL